MDQPTDTTNMTKLPSVEQLDQTLPAEDDGQAQDGEVEEVVRVKKKKKRKPKSKRGLNKPTGFEEFHADGPLTAEEAAEDHCTYDKDLPFIDRILTAIQRFERTRKLNPERRDVFYKYLAYGGVDVGTNMFQGAIDEESLDKDQLTAALARTSIADDKKDMDSITSLYAVDFEGCMRAFLSHRAPVCYGFETRQQVELVTTTLERFMDYLLQHEVCQEYQAQVLSTRNLCRRATEEIWNGAQVAHWLPGDFNVACSTLTGSLYGQMYDGHTSWTPERDGEAVYVGLTPDQAHSIIKYAVAGAASEDIFTTYLSLTRQANDPKLTIIETRRETGFEIVKILPITKQCAELYNTKVPHLQPVGLVYAKAWTNPSMPPEDLTPEEQLAMTCQSTAASCLEDREYVFLIEQPILQMLRVGTKIEATLHKLNFGMWFFDEVIRVYPSFESWICNEMMIGWKEPREIERDDDVESVEDDKQDDDGAQVDGRDVEDVDPGLNPNSADHTKRH